MENKIKKKDKKKFKIDIFLINYICIYYNYNFPSISFCYIFSELILNI